MFLRPYDCPRCGAPLPEDTLGASSATCPFCKQTLVADPGVVWAAAYRRALASVDDEAATMRDVVRVGDVAYAVEGRLARGESTDVFLARRARRVTERVVLKILRAHADADLLAREASTLTQLQSSRAPGAAHFSRLIPQLVAHGHVVDPDGARRPTTVLRFHSGFSSTFADVRAAYPAGVDPRAAVWMWRRVLETLEWVHQSGWVHGALVPQHLLVHPRDHGVLLVGWSCAARVGEPPPATIAAASAFHPRGASTEPASARTDLAMSARCIASVLGGDPETGRVPASVPSPLAALVRASAEGSGAADAGALHDAIGATAAQLFGAPTYVPFVMP